VKSQFATWPIGTGVIFAVAVAATAWPLASAALVGDREAMRAGEIWRAWTAHGVHFSWSHLGWSSLLWLVAGGMMERESRRAWLASVWLVAPLVTGAALWLDPQSARYGGLSGMACVPLVWLGLGWALRGEGIKRLTGVGVLCAVVAKVAWEFCGGAGLPFLADFDPAFGEVRAAPWAHVAGALGGVLVFRASGGGKKHNKNTAKKIIIRAHS